MTTERTVIVNVSAAARHCVVTAVFHRLGREDRVEVVSVRLLVDPSADCCEHVPLDLDALVTKGWVMEGAEDIGHHFFHWDTWVLPCVEDARSDVL